MEHLRLHRTAHRPPPHLNVAGEMALRLGRVHEICGPARRSLALRAAAQVAGPVIWIRPAWQMEQIHPDGACAICDPARLIFADCRRAEDLLWCLEETLRAGAVALAVAELPDPPALTPVRRLTLAAGAGAEASGRAAPLGLLLTPGRGGAAGVESRWQATPAHGTDSTAWRIDRLRARAEAPKTWHMDAAGRFNDAGTAPP